MLSNGFRFALLSTWLVLVTLHFQGRGNTPPADSGIAAAALAGSADSGWMGVYMNDNKVGYTHYEFQPTDEGYRLDDRSVLRLRMLNADQTVNASIRAETARDYSLRSFQLRLRSNVADLHLTGKVEGDTLVFEMNTGQQSTVQNIALDGPIYLPSAARARLVEGGLTVGDSLRLAVFDPAALSTEDMTIEVIARESLAVDGTDIPTWHAVESFHGVESHVWFDDDGRPLREEGPMGLVAVRETASQATRRGWDADGLVDLMDNVAVTTSEPILAPRELRALHARVEGLSGLEPIDDMRQKFRGPILDVTVETRSGSTFVLPYTGDRWPAEMASTPFVQADHPAVRDAAIRVVGEERDARRTAVRLRHWVYGSLEKRAVASIPNTLQVLEMGAGDCNEHAVLFAGLGRALGLPTRIVAGVMYADGAFLYHAWNEVWLGEGWVSVDPAFDQMPVDATHIKLVEGGPHRHIRLVPVIGQLSIEVLPPVANRPRSSG